AETVKSSSRFDRFTMLSDLNTLDHFTHMRVNQDEVACSLPLRMAPLKARTGSRAHRTLWRLMGPPRAFRTCSSLKSMIAAGVIPSMDPKRIEADSLAIAHISPEKLISSTAPMPVKRSSTRMRSPHRGFTSSNLRSGSEILPNLRGYLACSRIFAE